MLIFVMIYWKPLSMPASWTEYLVPCCTHTYPRVDFFLYHPGCILLEYFISASCLWLQWFVVDSERSKGWQGTATSVQQGRSQGASWLSDCTPCSSSLSWSEDTPVVLGSATLVGWGSPEFESLTEKKGQLFLSHFLTLLLLLSTVSHVWLSVTSQQSC